MDDNRLTGENNCGNRARGLGGVDDTLRTPTRRYVSPSRPPGLFRAHLDLRLDAICRRLDSEVKRLNALPEFERSTD